MNMHIKTIHFLFYNYVFNSIGPNMADHFGTSSVISSVEVYDKHIITCLFHIIPFISPRSYIIS